MPTRTLDTAISHFLGVILHIDSIVRRKTAHGTYLGKYFGLKQTDNGCVKN